MRILAPLCVFGLCAGLFFAVAGAGQGAVIGNYTLISGDKSWSITPAKYVYFCNDGEAQVNTTIFNLLEQEGRFDMGDGNAVTVPCGGNVTYTYTVSLNGTTTRYFIEKEGQGWVKEALTLKIEPRWKGGEK